MLQFGLLSAWHVHAKDFVTALLQSGLAQVPVVWDDDVARGEAFAEEIGATFEPDLDRVLERTDIQGVLVECRTGLHRAVICKAAAAKKHIFTDKELALTVEDCLAIQRAVEENGVKFAISLESKAIGPYRYARELVEQGMIGAVHAAYFRRAHQAALDRDMLPAYWYDPAQTGGGATLDLGCHGFYMLMDLLGKPARVRCAMHDLYESGFDDISTAVIEFENGAIGTAHTSFVAQRTGNLFEIIGTRGQIVIAGSHPDDFHMLIESDKMPGYERLRAVDALPPNAELPIVSFARMVGNNVIQELPEYSLDTAVALTRVIDGAYRAAQTGMVQSI